MASTRRPSISSQDDPSGNGNTASVASHASNQLLADAHANLQQEVAHLQSLVELARKRHASDQAQLERSENELDKTYAKDKEALAKQRAANRELAAQELSFLEQYLAKTHAHVLTTDSSNRARSSEVLSTQAETQGQVASHVTARTIDDNSTLFGHTSPATQRQLTPEVVMITARKVGRGRLITEKENHDFIKTEDHVEPDVVSGTVPHEVTSVHGTKLRDPDQVGAQNDAEGMPQDVCALEDQVNPNARIDVIIQRPGGESGTTISAVSANTTTKHHLEEEESPILSARAKRSRTAQGNSHQTELQLIRTATEEVDTATQHRLLSRELSANLSIRLNPPTRMFSRRFLTKCLGGSPMNVYCSVAKSREGQIYPIDHYVCWSNEFHPLIPAKPRMDGAVHSIGIVSEAGEFVHDIVCVLMKPKDGSSDALRVPMHTFCKRSSANYEYVGRYVRGDYETRLSRAQETREIPVPIRNEWIKGLLEKSWGTDLLHKGGVIGDRFELATEDVEDRIKGLMRKPDNSTGTRICFYRARLKYHDYDSNLYEALASADGNEPLTTRASASRPSGGLGTSLKDQSNVSQRTLNPTRAAQTPRRLSKRATSKPKVMGAPLTMGSRMIRGEDGLYSLCF